MHASLDANLLQPLPFEPTGTGAAVRRVPVEDIGEEGRVEPDTNGSLQIKLGGEAGRHRLIYPPAIRLN